MSDKHPSTVLAEHYYAVAIDLERRAVKQLGMAKTLALYADRLREDAVAQNQPAASPSEETE